MWCIVWLCLVVVNFENAESLSCYSLKNIVAELKDDNNEVYNKTLDGCIERIAFDNKTITEASIRSQNIPKLGRDTIRNMAKLHTVLFWKCNLEVVEPVAFRNIPRLKNVQISYCNLQKISYGVFNLLPRLTVLRIDNNKIDFIDDQAFANLTELKRVYAGRNNLENWNRKWFDETSTSLEVIDFQHNKIKAIPRKAFALLENLKNICFDWNEITAIQPNAFEGLKYLDYLGLRNNRLKEINGNIFPNKLKIKSLLINANYLNFLSRDVLNNISVKNIIMDYNPWKCACLDQIHYWLYTINGTLRKSDKCNDESVPVCALPKVYSQSCLEYIDDELTERYLNNLRGLSKKLADGCARLDR